MTSFHPIAWFLTAAFALAPPAAQAQAPTVEAHLASYKTKATADRGWRVLTEAYSSVLYFHPAIHEVDLPGKGHYFRLYAEGDQELMATLCRSMAARKLYCVLHPASH